MSKHPVLSEGKVAVITGGVDGLGYASAKQFLAKGMKVYIVGTNEQAIEHAASTLNGALTEVLDVSDQASAHRMKNRVIEHYGRVDILMNNAIETSTTESDDQLKTWQSINNIDLIGIVNAIHCFSEAMIQQNTPGLIINTVSNRTQNHSIKEPKSSTTKDAVKILTETLQHNLRYQKRGKIKAKFFVPGYSYSGMMKQFLPEKPLATWTPDQMVAFMIERIFTSELSTV